MEHQLPNLAGGEQTGGAVSFGDFNLLSTFADRSSGFGDVDDLPFVILRK
jgi:hypothetical protein